mmetsp:Transcript_12101/g.31759  ORF Transcript_12101/g.31759 Transcript_12101/m.31759 type:complete len:285 (+) Transcript_12101:2-856(+)
MLQLDSISLAKGMSGGAASGTMVFTMQNNGLEHFHSPHAVCVHAPSTSAALVPSTGWRVEPDGSKACTDTPTLKARTHAPLPALAVEWRTAGEWIELTLDASHGDDAFVHTSEIRLRNTPETLTNCDTLCACASADSSRFDYSHECRSAVKLGSQCAMPKEAHLGSNWASGVLDEYFAYRAATYASGGRCQVLSTHQDTLLAVYSSCGRFGALEPLGFANSEGGRHADVTFDCVAGTTYYIFWNAEYMPGRHAFTIKESCSSFSCARAHRSRLMTRRFKQRRTT